MSTSEELDDKLKLLVLALQARLGRLPTEDEVRTFIFGDETVRTQIWNSNSKE